jgi:hypothetical protein
VRDKYREAKVENKKLLDLFYSVRPAFFTATFFCSALMMMAFIYFAASTKFASFSKLV